MPGHQQRARYVTVAHFKPQSEPNDIGYFYILVNDSFSNTWVKILTSHKPIAPGF